MPILSECENEDLSHEEKRNCTQEKINNFIKKNLIYPIEAKKNGVRGSGVGSFIVFKDGTIDEIKVTRSLGFGCDEEILRLINQLKEEKNWIPARFHGKTVSVQYNQVIKFSF